MSRKTTPPAPVATEAEAPVATAPALPQSGGVYVRDEAAGLVRLDHEDPAPGAEPQGE